MDVEQIAALARSDTAVSAPVPELRHVGEFSFDAGWLPFTGKPPIGATENPDRTVTLVLREPISVPDHRAGSGAGQPIVYRELVFRRLPGLAVQSIKVEASFASFIMARSLNLSLAAFSKLRKAASYHDQLAMAEVIVFLLQLGDGVPVRAKPQGDSGFLLPLLFPVSDGSIVHSSLRFHPLTKMQLAAIPKAKEAFVPFALHYATGLLLRTARRVADTMDAADALAVLEILMVLKENAESHTRPHIAEREGRA